MYNTIPLSFYWTVHLRGLLFLGQIVQGWIVQSQILRSGLCRLDRTCTYTYCKPEATAATKDPL